MEDCDEWQINQYDDMGSFTLTNREGKHMYADWDGWLRAQETANEIDDQRHVWINEDCSEAMEDCVVLRLAYTDDAYLYFNADGLWGGVNPIGVDSNTDENRRNLIWTMVGGEDEDSGQCMDEDWLDDGGDDCSWYSSNAESCGSYGDGAWDACCACGGGSSGSTNSTGECMDDYSWVDNGGDDCGWYYENAYACGSYGEGAWDACCACNGDDDSWDESDGECYDNWEWTDVDGDDCDYYYDSPEDCGEYGEGAWDACCACNGDDDWDMYYDECMDDRSWVDNSGDDCEWYDDGRED